MRGIKSIIETGGIGTIINVECHLSNSLPNIIVVGFANRSIDEARERIRGALASSNIPLPRKRITLNLAPADIPKEGSSFDLPMLLSILNKSGMVKHPPSDKTVVIGEVGLDGSISPVRGIIGKILAAKKHGIEEFWIPEDNLEQADLIPMIKLRTFSNIKNLYVSLNQDEAERPALSGQKNIHKKQASRQHSTLSLDSVVGQTRAKRSIQIAAAGQHNLMLIGPPGTGKSHLAQAASSVLPDLSVNELLEITHLHSLSSQNFETIINQRPFRAPHHSASTTSIVGGGAKPSPGEISLSHNGILFFDELPEFSRTVIESLRQPLENRKISIARNKDMVEFPANFLFIAAANPCPCGYYGTSGTCRCSLYQIQKYQRKISGPILDRIDLYVEVESIPPEQLLGENAPQASTKAIKDTVTRCRLIQRNRGKLNSELNGQEIQEMGISQAAKELLDQAAGKLELSTRGYIRSLRIARTIADLENSQPIEIHHISEALQYRKRTSELTSVP